MKSDFEMITRRFDRAIRVYPIADVHYGAINHMAAEWEKFCEDILKDEDAYIILNGDLINNNTRSSVGMPFTDTVRPREQKRFMCECLAPLRDRILLMTSGNHENRNKDCDDSPAYDIACKLDLEDIFRQDAAFLKLSLGTKYATDKYGDPAKVSYLIACTHGSGGGGIYTGATVNRNERWGNVMNADCVIVGHTHKGTVTRPSRIVLDAQNNRVTMQDYVVISCVSWQAYGEYSLQKMLLPSSTARPQVLWFNDKKKDIEVRW